MNSFKYFIFGSIISADNYSLSERTKQEIISRFGENKDDNKEWEEYDWEYILDPIKDKQRLTKLIELMKHG